MRWDAHTGSTETSTTIEATAATTPMFLARNVLFRIHCGSVSMWPDVNVVTTISSKLKANDKSAPATSAERISGNVINRNVVNGCAPRSADASSRLGDSRRSRAITLLYATTMQKA